MRPVFGILLAAGLLLGPAVAAKAQIGAMSASSAYPAGITTGSPYGANWSGFYGLNPGGMPLNTYNQPYNAYGANYSYLAPGTNYVRPYNPSAPAGYNSAYVAPGTTYSGAYAPNAAYRSGYSSTYSTYPYGTTTTYRRPGLFGRLRNR